MKRIVHDVEQRSPEWFALRLGRVTSSRADDMLATRKDKTEAAGRRNLRTQLMLERLTGKSMEGVFESKAMVDGRQREAEALAAYEIRTNRLLRQVGFISCTDIMAGASPDGIVGDLEGCVEVKCGIPATHWEYLHIAQPAGIPIEYRRQIAHLFFVCGVKWVDFVSFSPDFPEPLQLHIVRVTRSETEVADHAAALRVFLNEVDVMEAEARTLVEAAGRLRQSLGMAS